MSESKAVQIPPSEHDWVAPRPQQGRATSETSPRTAENMPLYEETLYLVILEETLRHSCGFHFRVPNWHDFPTELVAGYQDSKDLDAVRRVPSKGPVLDCSQPETIL